MAPEEAAGKITAIDGLTNDSSGLSNDTGDNK